MSSTATQVADIGVLGATGQQGGEVVRALLARGLPVRALTRHPDSERGRALSDLGVRVVAADMDEPTTLPAALEGVGRLFAMGTMAEKGPHAESAGGREVARAAAEAGIEYVVYSSVGGAERHTGIPHFDSKRRVEVAYESLRRSAGLQVTFLRPVFFMENLASFLVPTVEDGTVVVRMPLPGDRSLQLVAVEDIGTAAASLLAAADVPDAVELVGDELTGAEIAQAYGERLSLPARYEELPLDGLDDDGRAMFAWFAGPAAYDGDRAESRALVPDLHDLRSWLRERDPAVREAD